MRLEQENAMLPVKTLLHPTDLTEASDYAFDLACQIARLRGAKVVVLHVVPPPNRRSTGPARPGGGRRAGGRGIGGGLLLDGGLLGRLD